MGKVNKSDATCKPFLKWSGGKAKVIRHIEPLLPEAWGVYYEPFLGGGALFFHLASRQSMAGRAVLSDINERLVRTYRAVRDDVEEVIEALQRHKKFHTPEYYYTTRGDGTIDEQSDVAVAAWFIYLNKTCFNGLHRVNKKGEFNVPLGRYTNPMICDAENLRACSQALQGVDILRRSFHEVIAGPSAGDFTYFDPPYVPLTKTANFTAYSAEGFGYDEQARLVLLAWRLANRGVHVLLSNSDTPLTRDLYRADHFTCHSIRIGRSVSCKGDSREAVGELLITVRGKADTLLANPSAEEGVIGDWTKVDRVRM